MPNCITAVLNGLSKSAFSGETSLIRLLIYDSLKQFSSIPPIEPNGFRDVSKYMGVAPASINPPIHTLLWLFLSYNIKSPGVTNALNAIQH